MNLKNAEALLKQIQEGTASKEETDLFEQWYLQHEVRSRDYSEVELNQIRNKMRLKLPVKGKPHKYKLWSTLSTAAAILLMLSIGIWFFSTRYHRGSNVTWVTGDINAGKNMAILTLPNGQNIPLSTNKTSIIVDATKLTYGDGSSVVNADDHGGAKEEKPVMANLATPKGGTYQVILPDKTHVWLNADSKISFPSKFSGPEREVHLIGEAFFEVTKDKLHPFVVSTEEQRIEVLGTHFNVNAYADEPGTRTTLLEGSVRLSGFDHNQPVILSPGQEALRTRNGFRVSNANIQSSVSWKNGEFIFNEEPLQDVLRKVSRWYNVDIVYQSSIPKDFAIGGFVSRSQPLSVILETIAKTQKVSFRVEGRKIFVSALIE